MVVALQRILIRISILLLGEHVLQHGLMRGGRYVCAVCWVNGGSTLRSQGCGLKRGAFPVSWPSHTEPHTQYTQWKEETQSRFLVYLHSLTHSVLSSLIYTIFYSYIQIMPSHLKGIVHPKMKTVIYLMISQTCMTFFSPWNIKQERINCFCPCSWSQWRKMTMDQLFLQISSLRWIVPLRPKVDLTITVNTPSKHFHWQEDTKLHWWNINTLIHLPLVSSDRTFAKELHNVHRVCSLEFCMFWRITSQKA